MSWSSTLSALPIIAVMVSTLPAARASAQQFAFTEIANEQTFEEVGGRYRHYAMNENGVVAFYATRDDAGTIVGGLYTSDGTTTSTLIEAVDFEPTGGAVPFDINDAGVVVFKRRAYPGETPPPEVRAYGDGAPYDVCGSVMGCVNGIRGRNFNG